MNNKRWLTLASSALVLGTAGCETYDRLQHQYLMTFFVTSKGSGKGADYGGLTGADGYCQALSTNMGAAKRTWRAYLSATGDVSSGTHLAADRIGTGPWQNAKVEVIARNIEE